MVAEKYGKGSMDTVLPQKAVNCQLGGLEATEGGKDGQIHTTTTKVALAKLVLRFHVETLERDALSLNRRGIHKRAFW